MYMYHVYTCYTLSVYQYYNSMCFLNACSSKSVQLRVRTCAILVFRKFYCDCFVELLLNVHFAFILERDCIVHAVVQKTNLMYI